MTKGAGLPNGLAVPRHLGERAKNLLLGLGLLDMSKGVLRTGGEIFFPLLGPLPEDCWKDLPNARPVHADFPPRPRRPASLKEVLGGILSPEEVSLMGRSYDIVGRVAVLELPDSLLDRAERIGAALLLWLPVDTIALKTHPTSGEERVRGLRVVAGRPSLRTVHRENGLELEVDLSEAFFNPRLGGERLRVAEISKTSSLVIDMFAGVGPFAISIAKAMEPGGRVFAVEKNQAAYGYLVRNISANRAENIQAILGDAAEEVPRITAEVKGADGIVMNLPKSSDSFLETAADALRPGGRLHFYRLLPKEGARQIIEAELAEFGDFRIETFRRVEAYSPSRSIYVADAVLKNRRSEEQEDAHRGHAAREG